jgi:hypothetical protein
LGDFNGYCWGFVLNSQTGYPSLRFSSKDKDSFEIASYSDYQRQLQFHSWLLNPMIQNTLNHFWNMELVSNIEAHISKKEIFYRR